MSWVFWLDMAWHNIHHEFDSKRQTGTYLHLTANIIPTIIIAVCIAMKWLEKSLPELQLSLYTYSWLLRIIILCTLYYLDLDTNKGKIVQ